jgi:hypothetical protein
VDLSRLLRPLVLLAIGGVIFVLAFAAVLDVAGNNGIGTPYASYGQAIGDATSRVGDFLGSAAARIGGLFGGGTPAQDTPPGQQINTTRMEQRLQEEQQLAAINSATAGH